MESIGRKRGISLEPNIWLIENDLLTHSKTERRLVVKDFLLSMEGDYILDHKENGAPFLINAPQKEVSISYDKNCCVVYMGDGIKLGIDIQEIDLRIERTLDIFLNKNELTLVSEDAFLQTAAWSVKEAVFKRLNGSPKTLGELNIIELNRTEAKVETIGGTFRVRIKEHNKCVIAFTID